MKIEGKHTDIDLTIAQRIWDTAWWAKNTSLIAKALSKFSTLAAIHKFAGGAGALLAVTWQIPNIIEMNSKVTKMSKADHYDAAHYLNDTWLMDHLSIFRESIDAMVDVTEQNLWGWTGTISKIQNIINSVVNVLPIPKRWEKLKQLIKMWPLVPLWVGDELTEWWRKIMSFTQTIYSAWFKSVDEFKRYMEGLSPAQRKIEVDNLRSLTTQKRNTILKAWQSSRMERATIGIGAYNTPTRTFYNTFWAFMGWQKMANNEFIRGISSIVRGARLMRAWKTQQADFLLNEWFAFVQGFIWMSMAPIWLLQKYEKYSDDEDSNVKVHSTLDAIGDMNNNILAFRIWLLWSMAETGYLHKDSSEWMAESIGKTFTRKWLREIWFTHHYLQAIKDYQIQWWSLTDAKWVMDVITQTMYDYSMNAGRYNWLAEVEWSLWYVTDDDVTWALMWGKSTHLHYEEAEKDRIKADNIISETHDWMFWRIMSNLYISRIIKDLSRDDTGDDKDMFMSSKGKMRLLERLDNKMQKDKGYQLILNSKFTQGLTTGTNPLFWTVEKPNEQNIDSMFYMLTRSIDPSPIDWTAGVGIWTGRDNTEQQIDMVMNLFTDYKDILLHDDKGRQTYEKIQKILKSWWPQATEYAFRTFAKESLGSALYEWKDNTRIDKGYSSDEDVSMIKWKILNALSGQYHTNREAQTHIRNLYLKDNYPEAQALYKVDNDNVFFSKALDFHSQMVRLTSNGIAQGKAWSLEMNNVLADGFNKLDWIYQEADDKVKASKMITTLIADRLKWMKSAQDTFWTERSWTWARAWVIMAWGKIMNKILRDNPALLEGNMDAVKFILDQKYDVNKSLTDIAIQFEEAKEGKGSWGRKGYSSPIRVQSPQWGGSMWSWFPKRMIPALNKEFEPLRKALGMPMIRSSGGMPYTWTRMPGLSTANMRPIEPDMNEYLQKAFQQSKPKRQTVVKPKTRIIKAQRAERIKTQKRRYVKPIYSHQRRWLLRWQPGNWEGY